MNGQPMESALNEFFSEAEEQLQRISTILEKISRGDVIQKDIDSLYRDIHTLKGNCQLFALKQIGQLAHAVEASLEPIRSGKQTFSKDLLHSIYGAIDLIDQFVRSRSTTDQANPIVNGQFAATIGKVIDSASALFGADYRLIRDTLSVPEKLEKPNIKPKEPVIMANEPIPEPAEPVTEMPTAAETITRSNPTAPTQSVPAPIQSAPAAPTPSGQSTATTDEAPSTIRVQVSLLDRMMNLISEMVLVRNQVLQYSKKSDDFSFLALSQKLDLVTSELQEEVMKTRMQPIGTILSKFQRVVRDLAGDLKKEIRLELEGVDTELDKTLLEAIRDPLTHIIRNSCDHGIELPQDRVNAGKPKMGTIHVRSFQEGGHVIIEIKDDGKGLNLDIIRKKAVEKGVITSDVAQHMSDRDAAMLIFAPGFSTAAQISTVSGRGVGMDVVLTNIQRIGGKVELTNKPGKGLTVALSIPLTLAVVPAMIIECESKLYAIPQLKLQELLRIDLRESNKLEMLEGCPVYRLRDSLLPIVNLRDQFKIPSLNETESITVVVLNADGIRFGLVVDQVVDTADIVVKPLSSFMKSLDVFSGATIMGDGRVALILDVAGLAKRSGVFDSNRSQANQTPQTTLSTINSDSQDYLFFELIKEGLYCVPLCLVQRLEEFDRSQIEKTGNQYVAQYRKSILPLINLDQYLGGQQDLKSQDKITVIVVQKHNRLFGICVKAIQDVQPIDAVINDPLVPTVGILGTIVHQKTISTVVDFLAIIDKTLGIQATDSKDKTAKKKRQNKKILLAEDTVFFKRQIIKLLESEGFEVTYASDGAEAINILEQSPEKSFDLLISDIEMPNKNGFELAESVRKNTVWKDLPMIAITTRFRDTDRAKGKSVGFNEYLEKLKSDQVLEAIDRCLNIGGSQ